MTIIGLNYITRRIRDYPKEKGEKSEIYLSFQIIFEIELDIHVKKL